jgi:hypothetical protein
VVHAPIFTDGLGSTDARDLAARVRAVVEHAGGSAPGESFEIRDIWTAGLTVPADASSRW